MTSIDSLAWTSVAKEPNSARLALVWNGAIVEASKVQSVEMSRPTAVRTTAAVVTEGLRKGLCKAYVRAYGGGEISTVRLKGIDHLLDFIFKDFPTCYSAASDLEFALPLIQQRVTNGSAVSRRRMVSKLRTKMIYAPRVGSHQA